MAYAGGIDWVTIQKALQDWVVACTQFTDDKVIWGRQQGFRNPQPGIVMTLALIGDDGLPWIDHEPNYITFLDVTITSVDSGTDTLTATGHGRLTGDGPVQLSGADLPLNLAENINYWIIKVTDDSFQLAATYVDAMNGVAVSLADNGSGAMSLIDTDTTLRSGEEVKMISRSLTKTMLTLECYTGVGVGLDMAEAVLWRVNARRKLPSIASILDDANIGVIQVDRVRATQGTQDLVLFEPRAFVDVMLHITSEDYEIGGIIERTEITNEDEADTFNVDGAG